MDSHELLRLVSDEKSFLAFVEALRKERGLDAAEERVKPSSAYGPTQRGWENVTIEAFLEAACAWAEDANFGEAQKLRDFSLWKKFATFLYMGKIYG